MRICVLVLVALLIAGPARGDEPPAADAKLRALIEAWIEDLRADAYETRQVAREQLKRNGPRAPDLLRAHANDEDPEVRRTLRELLGADWQKPTPGVARWDLKSLGIVRLPAAWDDMSKALDALASLQHAAFEQTPRDSRPLKAAKPFEGPFFDVLDALIAPRGYAMPKPFDRDGVGHLVAQKASVPRPPRAATGPFELRVREVGRTRRLGGEAKPTYHLELSLRWAPGVQVTQMVSPRLVRAVDAKGCVMVGSTGGASTTHGVGSTQMSRVVPLGLVPEGVVCIEHLAELDVEFPRVRVRTGMQIVQFEELGSLPRTSRADGAPVKPDQPGNVELRAIRKEGTARRPQYVVDVVALLPARTAQQSAQVFLTWSDGRRERLHVMGGRSLSADGTLGLTARAWPRGERTPKTIEVRWFEDELEGPVTFRFRDVPLK